MSDFDLSLIREFRSRSAFYDRNSPLFKDKVYNAQAWQDISNILGYDVALLKDRMLQLRNRYNLEKRRLEQLAEENPGKRVRSPWPLYEHLGFLSEHIRSRRSFKRMMPRLTSVEMNNMSSSNLSTATAGHSATLASTTPANGLDSVKLENDLDGDESDSQSALDDDEYEDEVLTKAVQLTAGTITQNADETNLRIENATTLPRLTHPPPSAINIRSIESMRTIIPKHNIQSNIVVSEPHAEKKRCLNTSEIKYEAFGQFVASSLVEMPKQQALLLVEKFTSELVKVLIEKNERANALPTAGGGVPMANNNNNNGGNI